MRQSSQASEGNRIVSPSTPELEQRIKAAMQRNSHFMTYAQNLLRVRQSKGHTPESVANFLGISFNEYRKFEHGLKLPTPKIASKLADFLEIPKDRIMRWATECIQKRDILEGNDIEDRTGEALKQELDLNITKTQEEFERETGQKLSMDQLKSLKELRKVLPRIVDLPILPMNYSHIALALDADEVEEGTYLHEFQNFMAKGESLAEYVSRDVYLGPFTLYAANILFYNGGYDSIEKCLNQLTIEEFKLILRIATFQYDIYGNDQDVPQLQRHIDFGSYGCLFVRELRKNIDEGELLNVNFDHLEQACLLQGLGQIALFWKLKPKLFVEDNQVFLNTGNSDSDIFSEFNSKLFYMALKHIHATASAIIAKTWGFPEEVIEILRDHHEYPAERVDGTCAMLKIVNQVVSNDFPDFSEEKLKKFFGFYPQIREISYSSFAKVCTNLRRVKRKMEEQSSSLLQNADAQVANYVQQLKENDASQDTSLNRQGKIDLEDEFEMKYDPEFQLTLKTMALSLLKNFHRDFIFSPKKESVSKAGTRVVDFNLAFLLVMLKDVKKVADRKGMEVSEVEIRLGLKK